MTTKFRIAIVVACAAVCAGVVTSAAAAPAGAAGDPYKGYKYAKFKVTVKGTQKVVQQHHHSSDDPCDPENFSSGSETWTFASKKPVIVQATMIPGEKNPLLLAGKTASIPVSGKVRRSYTSRIGKAPEECGDNGGGVIGETPQPDCGTKPVTMDLDLEYLRRPRGFVQLSSSATQPDPFEYCPDAGVMGYPYLLLDRPGGKDVAAELPASDLFDPDFQQWISFGSGKLRYRAADYWSEAKVRWEVNWTRLKARHP